MQPQHRPLPGSFPSAAAAKNGWEPPCCARGRAEGCTAMSVWLLLHPQHWEQPCTPSVLSQSWWLCVGMGLHQSAVGTLQCLLYSDQGALTQQIHLHLWNEPRGLRSSKSPLYLYAKITNISSVMAIFTHTLFYSRSKKKTMKQKNQNTKEKSVQFESEDIVFPEVIALAIQSAPIALAMTGQNPSLKLEVFLLGLNCGRMRLGGTTFIQSWRSALQNAGLAMGDSRTAAAPSHPPLQAPPFSQCPVALRLLRALRRWKATNFQHCRTSVAVRGEEMQHNLH